MRAALLLALALALPLVGATPSCTGSFCKDQHDYKGGPGNCDGSSTTFAEARDDSARYDDGTASAGALAGESCYAKGQPPQQSGKTILLTGDAGALGIAFHASLAWSNNRTAERDTCTTTLVFAGPTGAVIVPLPCAADPPWIYHPSPLLP
jgi:hypothetical protein